MSPGVLRTLEILAWCATVAGGSVAYDDERGWRVAFELAAHENATQAMVCEDVLRRLSADVASLDDQNRRRIP